jgi:transposase
MHYRIRLTNQLRQTVVEQLVRAYQAAHLRLIKRIHAVLYIVDNKSVAEVSELLHLGEQTVRDYVHAFLLKGTESLRYCRPPGRPARLSQTQRKELAALITAGPEAAGYTSGCWMCIIIESEPSRSKNLHRK